MFRADLHCHSNCSDGTKTPEEIVQLAHELGLNGLSIADHDTAVAYTPELYELAKKLSVELITGVEISTRYKGTSVHILAYGFDPEKLASFCNTNQEHRRERNKKILDKLRRIAIDIDEEELAGIGRPHIAMKLVDKGHARDIKDAFNRYIGDDKPCYSPGNLPSPAETIQVIHDAGGKAFIAHPHLTRNRSIIDYLFTLPIDGIECYYSLMPKYREKEWLSQAKKRNLLISGGSDFHGDIKPDVPLGASWVDKEAFDKIASHG